MLESRPILVATIPAATERLCRLLDGQRVVCPATLAGARAALARERFALAVLGVHFEQSRMFELMSFARAAALNREVPILCVLGARRKMSDLTVRLLDQTINSMWRCAFLNLSAIPDDAAGNAFVGRALMEHLEPPVRPLQQLNTST